ncbi:hypothetical protein ILP92_04015 [Maribius pontilimi]|uniref:Uncharacterized protein n=1 Tax=Palleronia pontilimi TaxID=1964209 RepID=A0A934M8Y1_9RHOB|nr:hypothetical protein [Palleronia pontilimi]MBJ3761912.1 hypothetical protein [Palleronia pontilimi]
MSFPRLKRLTRPLTQTALRVREEGACTYFYRDTPLARHASLIEGALWMGALILVAWAVSLWTTPRAGIEPVILPLKVAFSAALLLAATCLGRAAAQGMRIELRIDRDAGTLQCHQSTAGGSSRQVFECPLDLVGSFYIMRVPGPHSASHFYARLTDGSDAVYLGSDDDRKLERLLDRLRNRDRQSAAALTRELVGLAQVKRRGPSAA